MAGRIGRVEVSQIERRGRPWIVGVAFAVAPFGAMLALGFLGPPEKVNLPFLLGITVLVYPFMAVPMLLIGGPFYLLLRHFDKVNLLTILGVGALTGFLMSLVLLDARYSDRRAFLVMTAAGGAAGLVFWLVWRLRKAC